MNAQDLYEQRRIKEISLVMEKLCHSQDDCFITGLEAEIVCLKEAVQKKIEAVKDPLLRGILKLRFIEGKSPNEIAKSLHYGTRWVYHCQAKALPLTEETVVV